MTVGFGAMGILQAAAHNFPGLMVIRFLLGIFEAGFGPGVALYLSFFYHRREMGLRYGLWISFSALASAFASALAYAIVHAHSSLATWKLLFIVGKSPPIFSTHSQACDTDLETFRGCTQLSRSAGRLPLPPQRPLRSEIPKPPRKPHPLTRASRGRGGDTEKKLNFQQVFAAFYDYKNYLTAIIIFCLNTAFGSLPAYLPTIVEAIGYTSIRTQGLSSPPYLAAFFLCVLASFLSDRCGNRGYWISGFAIAGAIGYLILATVHKPGVRYFACYLVCAGVFPGVTLTFTWVTDNQGSASKRGAGLAIFGMIGQIGPILGARLYPTKEAPIYSKGMYVCAGLLLLAAVTAQVLSLSMRVQNKRPDRDMGQVMTEDIPEDVADVGDAHPLYRYILGGH